MPRLVVNPGSAGAWEIELKTGTIHLGRAASNDFTIPHESVSGTHCQVVTENGQVLIRDLGSTNGTMVDRSRVTEASLQPGQTIHLGSVEMLLHPDGDAPVNVQTNEPPAVRPAQIAAPRIRIAAPARPAEPPLAEPPPLTDPPLLAEPPPARPMPGLLTDGPTFCKFHAKIPARFRCQKCNRYFCDLCVNTLGGRKMCRACGVEVAPLQVSAQRAGANRERGFFAKLPGAFVYPFRGFGVVMLILATLAFTGLGFVSGGLFAIGARIVFYGFLFLFLQNIIHTTTQDERESLGFPQSGGLLSAAFSLVATVGLSFGLPIGLLIARLFEVDIPGWTIFTSAVLGCVYFPMAFLAVAMKDSVIAANPFVVFTAIMKIPLQYLAACLLLIGILVVYVVGNRISAGAGQVSFTTRDMSVLEGALAFQAVWSLLSIYLLTVNMRILGLLYNANQSKFGWYNR
jgi:hypothetical protein